MAGYTINRRAVKRLRIRGMMTQAKLAKVAGVSKQTITRMEGGTNVPQFETIEKVAKALGVEPSALIVYDTCEDQQEAALPGSARDLTDLREGLDSLTDTPEGDCSGETDGRQADQGKGA